MTNTHPARDAEFLSRLHDGELSAAERAHFESHRAHCAECRRAASEFESALSLYRSSRTAPAAPDLAARILRKLQKAPARRRWFGPTFGIDLRWAGAFAAAVIATIIGASIVGRQEAAQRIAAGPEPIRVVVERRSTAPPAPALAAVTPDAAAASAPRQNAAAPSEGFLAKRSRPLEAEAPSDAPAAAGEKDLEPKKLAAAKEEGRADGKTSAAPAPSTDSLARNQAMADSGKQKVAGFRERDAAKPQPAPAAPYAPQPAPSVDTSASAGLARQAAPGAAAAPRPSEGTGGEGGAAMAQEAVRAPRMRIEPMDGLPSAPTLLGPAPDLPASLRGRSWLVQVDAAGRVARLREQPASSRRKDADVKADEIQAELPRALLELRFAPGDRPRRLLLRVE